MQILLLTGGASAERDVAIVSSAQVAGALRERGHTVTVADTTVGVLNAAGEARLFATRVDRTPPDIAALAERERKVLFGTLLEHPAMTGADLIFLGLHGGRGEDGTLQHLLDLAGLRYTGAGALGSGMAMDKDVAKRLFRTAGIPTADWRMAPAGAAECGTALGWPLIVKPSKQGSTVGLSVVEGPGTFAAAVAEAQRHDDEVMIEAFVPGRELTVGILGDEALAVGEIIPKHALFDYECKYTPGMVEEIFPATLADGVARDVQRLGILAHRTLKLRGYSRVDFRLTPDGRLYCLEVNTLPGMTRMSLLPQSAAAVGITFPELVERICREALRD